MFAVATNSGGTDTAAAAIGYLVGLGVLIALMIGAHQKGRPALCWLGLLGMIFPLVGVCRLAKPGSAWYTKRYGHDKRKRSWERWEQTPYEVSILPAAPVKAWRES